MKKAVRVMTKAKTIDRLELTRLKMAFKANLKAAVSNVSLSNSAYPGAEETMEHVLHGDLCPVCGRNTLIHESGCVKCFACNWSKCG